jgi:hypothetical protein
MSLNNILDSYWIALKYAIDRLPKSDVELFRKRADICKGCPSRKMFVCGQCGCPIAIKVKNRGNACPLKKW